MAQPCRVRPKLSPQHSLTCGAGCQRKGWSGAQSHNSKACDGVCARARRTRQPKCRSPETKCAPYCHENNSEREAKKEKVLNPTVHRVWGAGLGRRLNRKGTEPGVVPEHPLPQPTNNPCCSARSIEHAACGLPPDKAASAKQLGENPCNVCLLGRD